MKIGIYDSGIGGLSMLNEIMLHLPYEEYCYYADTAHVPYGEKSREEVISFANDAVSFLVQHAAKAVVVACNTATSAAISFLRSTYSIPLLGMEPAVKPALQANDNRRVLVLATPLTLRESKLNDLLLELDAAHCVDLHPMPQLVRFAECGEFDSPAVRDYCCRELSVYQKYDYSSIVLGCTHFNYFKDSLRELFPAATRFIDGCDGTARNLLHIIGGQLQPPDPQQARVDYFFSGRPATEQEVLKLTALRQRLQKMREI